MAFLSGMTSRGRTVRSTTIKRLIWPFQCAENVKSNQATVAGIKSNPKGGFDARVTYQKTLFDVDSLARFGK